MNRATTLVPVDALDEAIAARGANELIDRHRAELAGSQDLVGPNENQGHAAVEKEPSRRGYSFAEAIAKPLVTTYVIKNFARPNEITVLFGDSGALKSFVAIDAGLHVAAGLELWLGNRVRGPRGVLFLIGEGAAGFPKRLRVWAMERGVTTLPAYCYPAPVDLFGGPHQLARAIEEAEDVLGCSVGLVVLDPLGVMFGEGDEGNNSVAARVMNNIREGMGPERAALAVHHVGHGDKDRERGAYQIRSNADARFIVKYEKSSNVVTIDHLKEKDGPTGDPSYLGAKAIVLGTDVDGDAISSLVLEATAERPSQVAEWKGAVKQADQQALRVLSQVWLANGRSAVGSAAWRQELYRLEMLPEKSAGDDSDANRKAFQRLAKVLRDAGFVSQAGVGKATAYCPSMPGANPEESAT